jgi:N-acetylglucosaminyl-diphospho-decaprenol L-rhamnosyltransferase
LRTDNSSLAVVTVTHNSAHVIEGWIDSLEETGHRERMELCVVDSGSTPDQRDVLDERVAPRVDSLRTCPNLGYGRSCNVGAAATTAATILFTNPDTRVRSLPTTVLENGATDGQVIGAYKTVPSGERLPLGFKHSPSALWEAQKLVLGRWSRAYIRTISSPAWVSGSALLIGRREFERVGGFSDELFLYFEDADLCARHRALGGRVAVDAGFVVEHGSGKSAQPEDEENLLGAREAVSRLSARIFAARHGSRWHRPMLYALLALAYMPRRVLAAIVRRRTPGDGLASYVADLLLPRRVLRRLGVPNANRARS